MFVTDLTRICGIRSLHSIHLDKGSSYDNLLYALMGEEIHGDRLMDNAISEYL